MPVTEHERHQLFTWFEEHLGQERAATMMNLLPPVSSDEIVTREYLHTELDRLRADLQRTLGTWIFASQAAVIGAMGLLLGLSH
jgi:hypothetical protein